MVGFALLAAVTLDGVPEIWALTAVLLTGAVVAGNRALAGVDPSALAFPLAFAGGCRARQSGRHVDA